VAVDITRLWFGFAGRINRAKYWLVTLVSPLIVVLLVLTAIAANSWAIGILVLPIVILFLVSTAAIAVKRLHDRDKSAWWLLLFYLLPAVLDGLTNATKDEAIVLPLALSLASFAISVWAFVELGCLRGTIGPNLYGADPLEGRG
jgi:uncharacterized membrane protein YhaH (DUF805 family)